MVFSPTTVTGTAVLEYGPTEILPQVGALSKHAERLCRPGRQASRAHPRGKPGFWTFESGCGRETDSLLEGNGFEPSVPREIGLRSGSVNRRQTGRRRSDHGDTAMAVGAVDESCRLNRGNLNILSEARIHAPELIGYQVSVDPI
jgi:hypothetical protein